MNKVVLMDFSNIAYATYYAMQGYDNDEFETDEGKIRYWKFLMLNSIKKNKLKHQADEFIICCDSMSWRKKAFVYYKASREKMRKESNFDFKFFLDNMNSFIKDIDKNFPYTIMKINGAEADDIIAILAQHLRKTVKKVIIASNDKDFKQLVSGNIHLWSMGADKFMHVEDNHEYLVAQILSGDASDGIPNVRSDDDTFIVDGKRQKPCGAKLIGKILEMGVSEWFKDQWAKDVNADNKLEGTDKYQGLKEKSNQLSRNYRRNKKLIELSQNMIPKSLWKMCIEKYEAKEKKTPNFTKILHYLTRNRFKQLTPLINQFL
jgi:5'-3' exonuclease